MTIKHERLINKRVRIKSNDEMGTIVDVSKTSKMGRVRVFTILVDRTGVKTMLTRAGFTIVFNESST